MAGLGRPRMPQGSWAHGHSYCCAHVHNTRAMCHVLQLLKPTFPRALALQQEKPQQWDAHAPPLESSRCSLQLEEAHTQQGRSSTGKNKYINTIFQNARKWKSICLVMQSLLAFRARWFGIHSFGGRLKSCNTRTRYRLLAPQGESGSGSSLATVRHCARGIFSVTRCVGTTWIASGFFCRKLICV